MSSPPETAVPTGRKKLANGKERAAAALGREFQNTSSPEGAKEMRGLPSGWRWARMSEVCSRVQDGTHFSPKEQTRIGDFKYVTAKNIKHWGLDLTELTYVPERVHREIYKRCNVEKGDVLYIKDGVTTGIATVNTLDEEFSLLSSVALLKPHREILDSLFLKYYLNSPEGFRNMTGQMTGTAIKRLILQKIKASFVPVAPLAEQRRIVGEIEKQFTRLEVGVAALRRVQANLKRYRAAVLKAACEGRLVPTEAELNKSGSGVPPLGLGKKRQDAASTFETGEALLARILTERRQNWQGRGQYKEPAAPDTAGLPTLAEGWTWARLEQLGLTFGGLTKNPKRAKLPKQLPYLRVANVYANELRLEEIEHIGVKDSELAKLLVRAGDLLIVEGNGSKDQIGRLAIWDGSIDPCLHQNHIIKVRSVEARMPKWILYWLQSPNGRHFVELVASSTSGLYTLSVNKVGDLPIAVPPLAEQTRIVAEVERRLSVVDELEAVVSANLQRATRLRQSILHKAFSGKL